MNFEEVFDVVKNSFCSLWTFRKRGNTLELITPLSTTTSKFVSVFITYQKDHFVVSDGGWLMAGEYINIPDIEDDIAVRVLNSYEEFHEVKSIPTPGGIHYFKTTTDLNLLSDVVYDVANFVASAVSSTNIQFVSAKEKEEKENFRKMADEFIFSIARRKVMFNRELSKEYKNVRFNVIIPHGSKVSLVKYVTGSTPNYFLGNLTKAIVDFEIAEDSPVGRVIENRITLINDQAPGFQQSRQFAYINALEERTKLPAISWSDRNKIAQYVS